MEYIDQSKIIDATQNGYDVFAYYFPGVDFRDRKHSVKIRSEEKTPSTKVSYHKNQWRITDFGNLSVVNSMSCVAFVMWKEDLMYIDALRWIEEVVIRHSVGREDFKKPSYKAEYSWREVAPEDVKGNYNFTYKNAPSDGDLRAIGRYVTAELLSVFNFKAVEKYEMCSYSEKYKRDVVHIFASTPDYPIFVLDEGSFKKIYKPHETDKKYRFSYVGQKPANYIFGLKQLQDIENEFVDKDGNYSYSGSDYKTPVVVDLIRCSGESDALNVASLGYHVYWLNSESAEMDGKQFSEVDDMCETHYQLMDLDPTGKANAMKFAHRHINLHTIQLPDWLKHRNDWRGNPCKDIKDFINIAGGDQDETMHQFNILKRRSFPMKFWIKNITKTKDGSTEVSYSINLENYYYFLQSHGWYISDSEYHRKAGYCYAKIDGKKVDLILPEHVKKMVKRFTKEWIRSKGLIDEVAVLNKINSSNQIGENNLQELEKIELNFCNHTSTTEWLHFDKSSLKITREKIEKVKQEEVQNNILGSIDINGTKISHVIDKPIWVEQRPAIEVKATEAYQALLDKMKGAHNDAERENINVEIANFPELDRFEVKINDSDFVWVRFLKDVTHIYWDKELEKKQDLTETEKKEQDLLLANIMFVMGFLTAQYKNPGKAWLVFLQDIKISEIGKSSGRSGKSLLTQAVAHTRPTFYIGGKRKDITEKTEFIYDGYTKFHNNIDVDDLYEFADINFFYTQVTGKREVNSKHISKQILEYADSGKMAISTNYELANTDSSTMARILSCAVSDYYHEKTKGSKYQETRTPLVKFDRELFTSFSDEEWAKFYNFMAYCIQLQMRYFKIQPPMGNIEKRQLRRLMTHGLSRDEEFFHWANSYFIVCPDSVRPDVSPDERGYFNVLIKRNVAFEDFKKTLTDVQMRKYKAQQFRHSMQSWCEYYAFELNPLRMCTGKNADEERRIIKSIESATVECFYIDTSPPEDRAEAEETESKAALTEDEQKLLPF
jgi:hypothetical protein